jgi:hypothetical protein
MRIRNTSYSQGVIQRPDVWVESGNTNEGSITVALISCLTGLKLAV